MKYSRNIFKEGIVSYTYTTIQLKYATPTQIQGRTGLTQVRDEIKIDGLVRETGEFVAKAEVVFPHLFNVE